MAILLFAFFFNTRLATQLPKLSSCDPRSHSFHGAPAKMSTPPTPSAVTTRQKRMKQPHVEGIYEDRAMLPLRVTIGHVDDATGVLRLGSLPSIPPDLDLDDQMALNKLQIQMMSHHEDRVAARSRMEVEKAAYERAIIRETRAQLMFRQKLLEFEQAKKAKVARSAAICVSHVR